MSMAEPGGYAITEGAHWRLVLLCTLPVPKVEKPLDLARSLGARLPPAVAGEGCDRKELAADLLGPRDLGHGFSRIHTDLKISFSIHVDLYPC